MKHWTYLCHVLRHKALLWSEARKLGLPLWTAIVHDLDKFLPDEWPGHANAFGGPNSYTATPEFLRAANLHTKRNPHHWQFWVLPRNDGKTIALEIPDAARREMLADWRAAARGRGGNLKEWYAAQELSLHPETRAWIESQL